MAKLRRKPTPPAKSAKTKAKPVAAKSKPLARPAQPAAKPAAKPPARPVAKPAAKPAGKSASPKGKLPAGTKRPPVASGPAKAAALKAAARKPAAAAPPPPPPRRSTYIDAVAMYERGVQALQARKYREAADTLRAVIAQFPEEKELHERAVLYLRVCERQMAAAPKPVETLDDRVYAATVAINNAQLDQAIDQLTAVASSDPEHDHAMYMLGVAHALKGDYAGAVRHLSRAMALNPENRDLARKEPDLEALRHTDDMRQLLASPPAPIPRRTPRVARPRR